MVRPNARTVVATMKNQKAGRDWTVLYFPRYSVCQFHRASPKSSASNPAIAGVVSNSLPFPARRSLSDHFPKTFFYGQSWTHVAPPGCGGVAAVPGGRGRLTPASHRGDQAPTPDCIMGGAARGCGT